MFFVCLFLCSQYVFSTLWKHYNNNVLSKLSCMPSDCFHSFHWMHKCYFIFCNFHFLFLLWPTFFTTSLVWTLRDTSSVYDPTFISTCAKIFILSLIINDFHFTVLTILLWNSSLVHNKIWSLWNFSFHTIARLSWSFTVYDYHMNWGVERQNGRSHFFF